MSRMHHGTRTQMRVRHAGNSAPSGEREPSSRLAQLEKRVAALEVLAGAAGGSPAPEPSVAVHEVAKLHVVRASKVAKAKKKAKRGRRAA